MVNECTAVGFGIGLFFGSTVGMIIIQLFIQLRRNRPIQERLTKKRGSANKWK